VLVAIDTAGVRRKKSLATDIEFYSMARAERSIRRADVVLLFLDAPQKISKVDKQLADYVFEQSKPAVFVVNKWDLMAPMPTERMARYVKATFPSLDHVPIAFITAKSGRNVQAVLNLCGTLHKQASARVGTGDLNRVVKEALLRNPPPMRQNRRAKVYYATQVGTNPPTIVLFTNGPELFDPPYLKYLLNTFRDQLPFQEVSIKLHVRLRKREDGPAIDELEAAEAPKKRKRPDGAKLKFRTRVEEGEEPGSGGVYESELWRDV
jgi:GTP-binding protein